MPSFKSSAKLKLQAGGQGQVDVDDPKPTPLLSPPDVISTVRRHG